MTNGAINDTIRLGDGRSLGCAELGDPKGRPLFFFHGSPDSRLAARVVDNAAKERGVRIIALDRPGFGLSDFQPGRTLLDWSDDAAEAADALGIERFAVLSISAGGPFALACCHKVPDRLTGAAIVSSPAPPGAQGVSQGMMTMIRMERIVAERMPWLAGPLYWMMRQMNERSPERAMSQMSRSLCQSDQAVLADPDRRRMFLETAAESFRQGSRAAAQELLLYARPWGFRVEDIAMPVHLWHGEADVIMTPAMGRYLAESIPKCRATFVPEAGHFLFAARMDEILAALFSD